MIKFFYGRGEAYTDVTREVLESCFDGERILIPSGDTGGFFFPDPLPGILKSLIVVRATPDGLKCANCEYSNSIRLVPTAEERAEIAAVLKETSRGGGIEHPPSSFSTDEKINFYHAQLKCTGGDITHEWREQTMVVNFLDPDAKVLELGSNIGRNTLMIACVLNDDRNLVTLECNPFFVELLRNNRFANGFNFRIEPSALSKRKLIQSKDNYQFGSAAEAWEAIPSEELPPGYDWVSTVTFDELEAKHSITFDTLVADCEGALFHILEDDPTILRNIKTIIMESDFRLAEHKWAVERVFNARGFEKVHADALVPNLTALPQECADSFWEVWKVPD